MKRKYQPYILSDFVSFPMCLIMSLIGVVSKAGFFDGWLSVWLKAFIFMFPVAYTCALIFAPLAHKTVRKMKWIDKKTFQNDTDIKKNRTI